MLTYLIGGLAMAVLCSGWVLIQRWIAHTDPEVRSLEDGCHGCGGCGSCERKSAPPVQLPPARARPVPDSE